MKKLTCFTFAFIFFTTACKKTEAPVGFNDPVFMVAYTVGALSTDDITAGLDDVYHFTRFETANGIFKSINAFTDVSCPAGDCPGSVTFEFRHFVALDTIFGEGTYGYTLPDSLIFNPTDYLTTFRWGDIFSQLPEQKFMFVNDSMFYSTPTQSVSLNLQNIPVQVSLTGYGSSGLQGTSIRTILPSDSSAYPGISIRATPNGDGYTLNAVQDLTGTSVVHYQWNTSDSTNTIEIVDSLGFPPQYAVTVSDIAGHTAVASLSSLPFPPQSVIRNAQLTFHATPAIDVLQIGTVAIQWVDDNGIIWRSDRAKQPFGSTYFDILEAEAYSPNENGDKVQKLRVRFKCLLFNVDGGGAQMFTGEGVVGMARP